MMAAAAFRCRVLVLGLCLLLSLLPPELHGDKLSSDSDPARSCDEGKVTNETRFLFPSVRFASDRVFFARPPGRGGYRGLGEVDLLPGTPLPALQGTVPAPQNRRKLAESNRHLSLCAWQLMQPSHLEECVPTVEEVSLCIGRDCE